MCECLRPINAPIAQSCQPESLHNLWFGLLIEFFQSWCSWALYRDHQNKLYFCKLNVFLNIGYIFTLTQIRKRKDFSATLIFLFYVKSILSSQELKKAIATFWFEFFMHEKLKKDPKTKIESLWNCWKNHFSHFPLWHKMWVAGNQQFIQSQHIFFISATYDFSTLYQQILLKLAFSKKYFQVFAYFFSSFVLFKIVR